MSTIAKLNGVTWASIAKHNGIAVASISKIDGIDKPAGGATDFSVRVNTSFDDGYSGSGGQFDSTTTQVVIGMISGVGANGFFTFKNITIPQGATINTAKLTFQAQASYSGTTVNLKIFANDVDNSSAPTTNAAHSAMARTTAYTAWSPGAQTAGSNYDTPDISTAIKEVVDRAGWASGNAMTILIDNNGSTNGAYRYEKSYDASSTNCALLSINYS